MLNHTRAEMKTAAKSALAGKWGAVIGALLLTLVVPGVVLFAALSLMGLMAGLCLGYGAIGSGIVIWVLFYILELAFIFLIIGPLMIAYQFFHLRLARGAAVKATMPYQCFSGEFYGRLTLAYFMQGLFIFLWSLLLYIPGIIKAFSYAMMGFILHDHPEMNWQSALNESKRMMAGNKADLFVLCLSFIPWLLLVSVTFGFAGLYVYPYIYTTVANFYRSLKEETVAPVKEIPNEFVA